MSPFPITQPGVAVSGYVTQVTELWCVHRTASDLLFPIKCYYIVNMLIFVMVGVLETPFLDYGIFSTAEMISLLTES